MPLFSSILSSHLVILPEDPVHVDPPSTGAFPVFAVSELLAHLDLVNEGPPLKSSTTIFATVPYRDCPSIISSPTASSHSSTSVSSLISFYAPAEYHGVLPAFDNRAYPLVSHIGARYENRHSAWTKKEELYYNYYDSLFSRLGRSWNPPFPTTGSSLDRRNIIRDANNSMICPFINFPVPSLGAIDVRYALYDSYVEMDSAALFYERAWFSIRIAYGDNGCVPIFYFPIATFSPSRCTDVTFNVFSPDGSLYRSTYTRLTSAPRAEYAWNLGEGPRTKFSILGAHYDRREEYIDRFPHDSPFRQDLAIQFVYEETAECLFGDEVVPLPITLYVYRRDSDLSFTELLGAVRGFGVPYRYEAGPNLGSCLGKDSFLSLVKRFKPGVDPTRLAPDGRPLLARDHIIDRHSGRKVMVASRNMVEEEALVFWLSPLIRDRLWSKTFTDFRSSFLLSSYATKHVWSVDLENRLQWAYYELPRVSAGVEMEFGAIGTAAFYEGLVRWFSG